MYKPHFLFTALLCALILSAARVAPLYSVDAGTNNLAPEMDGFPQWELIEGYAEFNETEGQQSIRFEGANGETLLRYELKVGENSLVKTASYLFPGLSPDGETTVDLNGFSLKFTGSDSGNPSISYYDGIDWMDIGSYESSSWFYVALTQDYNQDTILLKIDGDLVVEALDFTQEVSDTFDLKVKGSEDSVLVVNVIDIFSGESAIHADAGNDGLLDGRADQITDPNKSDATGDMDGDSVSDAEELARGTRPTDYYNGQVPILKKISGDLQKGVPGSYTAEPLVVQVSDAAGQPLINAPVTFEVIRGGARLSEYASDQASTYRQLTVRTNDEGLVSYGNSLFHEVLFYDGFDGETLDREQWAVSSIRVGRTEYGLEPELVKTDEGVSVARLSLDTFNPNPKLSGEFFYGTSIKTHREFDQEQVLEFEVRARLVDTAENPISRGLVGAFSLYNDTTRDEIDWSYLSNQMDESKVLTNIYNNGFPMDVGDVEYLRFDGLDMREFNTYTTRWSKDKIEYFLNGKLVRTGPNRGVLRDVPDDPLHVCLSLFAPLSGFAKAYHRELRPAGNQSLNERYFYDVDYVQVRAPTLEASRAAGTVPVYIRQGSLGENVITATATSESMAAQVSFSTISEYNERPDMQFRDNGDVAVGDQYTILWDTDDREGDARIDLYCDTDPSGSDGILIAEGLNAANTRSYVWQTQGVEAGNYYIYAIIDDGVNDPLTVYNDQSIYVPYAAYSENQLSNGGLESGEGLGYRKIEGWQCLGDAQHYSKQPYRDVFHAKLTGDAAYYQDVVTVVGQPWCASVYALNPSGNPLVGAASIRLRFYDSEGNELAEYQSESLGSDSPPDQYIPLKVDAVAPEKSVLARILLSLEGTGSVYFDEASLCKQVELNNPSFELGEAVGTVNIDYWQHFGETYLYEGGSRCGGWHTASFGTYPENGRENYSGCYQEVPAQEGELWHASIYVFNPSADPMQGNNEARLNLVFVDAGGNTLPGGENASKSVFSNSLKDQHLLLDVSAYAPPGTAFARIVPLLIQRENAKGCVFFDDARLFKEPGARNAGFELGDGYGSRLIWGWTPFGEGVYHDHTFPLDGEHHLRLVNEESDTHTGVYQDFAVIAGEAWRAKLFARVLPTDPLQGYVEAHLGLYYLDKQGEIVGGGELNSNKLDVSSPIGYYVPLAVAGIAPEGAVRLRLVPVIQGNGTGTVFVDRVSIEKAYKSHRDRDDDGLPDLWEQEVIDVSERDVLRLRSDIVAAEDLDKDGLNNKDEFIWGTDPLTPDTDGDGMMDGLEIANYSDPLDSELILKDLDTDGDGISNYDEIVLYGTGPRADTDGDGISDWVEIFQSFTDPLVDEFGEVSDLLQINGSEYTASVGSWQNQDASVYARDRRGSLNYALDIPEPGCYRLEIEGRQHNAYSDIRYFELSVQVDGIPLGTQTLTTSHEQSGTVGFYLPHLNTGKHTITVQWINGEPRTTLEIIALRLQAVSGADLNDNGAADWIDTRLSRMSDLDESQALSMVSPFTLEGTSYTLQQLSIQSDYSTTSEEVESIIPRQGLIGKYYAHVALNPKDETTIRVSDQGGAANFEKTVIWTETNIMDQEALSVRKEDSLLLTAFLPDSSPEEATLIKVAAPDGSAETFEITTDTTVAFCFEQVGTYQIKALVRETESALEVEVLNAELGANPIVYLGARDRQWLPLVPDEVILEKDPHIYLDEVNAGESTRNFTLAAGSTQPGTIIARLGEKGPIMDSTYVEAVFDYRNSNGSWDVTEVFPDGSRLVEITIQLSDIPDNLTVELTSIKAGVTFDDGLIKRTVTADEFDEMGVYRYRMIIAPGVDGSSCHKVNFYQGDTWIGGNY